MISVETILKELEFYKSLKLSLRKRLRTLPKGTLYYKKEHGARRPYLRKDGKVKYLNQSQWSLIQGLSNRKEIEKSLKLIDRNIGCLEWIKDDYTDYNDLIPDLLQLKNHNGKSNCRTKGEMTALIDSWLENHESPKKRRSFQSSDNIIRQHVTSDGTFVKSKSELLLYEFFKSKGVAFKYEQPIIINGKFWYPDFTLIRPSDGCEIVWEHLGMMHIESYKRQSINKLNQFALNNFWPFENLVLTYDFGDGEMDMAEIERILVMMKIIP